MVIYFSGTGNTKAVAEQISKVIGDELVSMNDLIKSGFSGNLSSEKPYVILAPVYAWRLPKVVEKFISEHEFEGSKECYVIMTCGDSSCAADKYARKLLESKGFNFRGFRHIVMPENYIAMFNVPELTESKKIIRKGLETAADIALDIREGREISQKSGSRIMSTVINKVFYAFGVKDKPFHIEGECSGCGLCESLCPMNNVEMSGGRPNWKGNCTHCMACICSCPSECIEYGKKSVGKRRYLCERDIDARDIGSFK